MRKAAISHIALGTHWKSPDRWMPRQCIFKIYALILHWISFERVLVTLACLFLMSFAIGKFYFREMLRRSEEDKDVICAGCVDSSLCSY